MALETASYISQLIDTNPTGGDPKGQGDDHLRLLKRVLKTQFPNLDSAVIATPAQLNQLATPNLLVFPGMITMWSGSLSSLPAGWLLCNGVGTISTGAPVPDLRDKFIVGAGLSYAILQQGGSTTHSHPLSISIGGTALTASHIPPHTHTIPVGSNDTTGTGWVQVSPGNSGGSNSPSYTINSGSYGSGAAHGHTATPSMTASSNLPPFYALGFIIKQ